jgi:2'-5' RNA ligase
MRAFVAIDIPDDVRDRVRSLLSELQRAASHVRWSRPEGLHITLKFLGEVPASKVPDVEARLRAMKHPEGLPSLHISISGAGYFPNERSPRIVWLGIQAGDGLAKLAAQVDRTLLPLGFAKEDRAFAPHLTLGRIRDAGPLSALREQLERYQPLELGTFAANEFFLYESQLARGGSIYRKVARFPLLCRDESDG